MMEEVQNLSNFNLEIFNCAAGIDKYEMTAALLGLTAAAGPGLGLTKLKTAASTVFHTFLKL